MFAILRHYGIPAKVVDAIARMYCESKGAVLVGGKSSEPFDITTGVLQGDVLAPFLFIIVMDYVMSRSEQNFGFVYQPRTGTSSRGMPEKRINDQDYADDEALLENTIARANEQLTVHCLEARGVGLEINADKTEYMVINPQPNERDAQLLLNGKPLKRVENFKYLGANLKSSAYDLACRRGQAWSAFWPLERIWRDKNIQQGLKLNIYKTAVLAVLFYGCETWTLTKSMETSIDGFGTNCLRVILGVKKIDHVTNAEIYERSGMRPLTCLVRERQLGYLGHILRRDDNEPSKTFALYELAHGRRPLGRPKLSYTRYVAGLISNEPEYHTRESISTLAQDRKKWRGIVLI